jgi:GntR family transcriptional regulator/MocR family aminotransferase
MVYQDPRGDPALRQAIASYLAIARGVACRADQVFITAGFQGALGVIARTMLAPRDRVWVEDPGYFMARDALQLAGARLVPVPVDGDGIDVAAGVARAPDARLAVVTPAHQAPLGVTLALARRLALLSWAARADAWIVEDDYDSEFRYRGRPLAALKSLDEAGRVLYVGTFSKVLFPSLRLGYLVVPDALVERIAAASTLLHAQPAPLNQAITADFIEQGHFARHIRRMRTLYGERRTALVAALRDHLGPIDSPPGGMQVLSRLRPGSDDVALAARAAADGLSPSPLSPLAVEAACGPGLLLSFTNLPAEDAPRAVRKLAALLPAQ